MHKHTKWQIIFTAFSPRNIFPTKKPFCLCSQCQYLMRKIWCVGLMMMMSIPSYICASMHITKSFNSRSAPLLHFIFAYTQKYIFNWVSSVCVRAHVNAYSACIYIHIFQVDDPCGTYTADVIALFAKSVGMRHQEYNIHKSVWRCHHHAPDMAAVCVGWLRHTKGIVI